MPRVLYLAHHFPPVGGVVGRNVAAVRHLPEHGYDCVVVTGPGDHEGRWVPRDTALVERVEGVPVHRAPGPVPGERTGVAGRLARYLERPAPWARWWSQAAVDAALAVDGPFDLVFANCIPYETAFAASRVAEQLSVPWVADL